jgi:alkanesulfonate monooxygenase SsuD/methylene tetrahydromethanopterin reductase-like flavin-dependent oxidoreductase (luciferase family)
MDLATELRFHDRRFAMPKDRIQLSEQWGYDAVFGAGDGTGPDSLTPLGYVAAITSRLKLGTCIAKVIARTPASMAMAFQTLDHMAGGGRTLIGLGSSDQRYAKGWHVHKWGSPVGRMRDYVTIMRQVASGSSVSYSGSEYVVPWAPEGEPAGPALAATLQTSNIPILLGAYGPHMVALAGEIADGWMPTGFQPGMLESKYGPHLERGFERAGNGKGYQDFQIWAHLDVNVDDDVRTAMLPFKQYVCTYPEYQLSLLAEAGFADAADRIRDELEDRHGANSPNQYHRPNEGPAFDDPILELVPDEYIDGGWLCGPLTRFPTLLEPWLSSGVTGLIVRYGAQVPHQGPGAHYEHLPAFREIARLLDKSGSD